MDDLKTITWKEDMIKVPEDEKGMVANHVNEHMKMAPGEAEKSMKERVVKTLPVETVKDSLKRMSEITKEADKDFGAPGDSSIEESTPIEFPLEQAVGANTVLIEPEKETTTAQHHHRYKTEKKCIMCGKSEWINIDYLRARPQKQILCSCCGFITFDRFAEQSEYRKFYNDDYRKQMINYSNLATTNRKIGYHDAFIRDYLTKNKDLTICDIGAGIGYFVRYCKELGHEKVYGTEYDKTMRSYAKNASNLDLSEEFDDSRKYDLVSMYHTIEHVLDPVELLKKIRDSLTENGKIYLAIPFWMDELMNFGGGAFHSYDEYFHENHINCWTKLQFKQFLFQNGFKVVKEEHKLYGYTVLCERIKPTKPDRKLLLPEYIKKEKNINDILFQLESMKRSATAYSLGDFMEAMRLYQMFPDAYMAECGKQMQNFEMQLRLLSECGRVCKSTVVHHMQAGVILYQRKEFQESQAEYMKALKYRPNDDFLLTHIGVLHKVVGFETYGKDKKEGRKILDNSIGYFNAAMKVNPKRTEELTNEITYIYSRLETGVNEKKSKFKQPAVEGAPQVAFERSEQGI